jgi:hypothetical protein
MRRSAPEKTETKAGLPRSPPNNRQRNKMIAPMLVIAAATATDAPPSDPPPTDAPSCRATSPDAAFADGERFRAEWRCRKEGWRVQRMQTFAGGQ